MYEPEVQRRTVLVVNFFRFLKSSVFCGFIVTVIDLVHDGKAIHGLC